MIQSAHDIVTYLLEWSGGAADTRALAMAKRAVQEARRLVSNAKNWSYYNTQGRIVTTASYATGTIEYDHCVTPEHEALTRTGWKTYESLSLGEEILAYDHDRGVCSWQPIEKIHTFEYSGEILDVRRKGRSVLRCTPNHRIPVIERVGRGRGQKTRYTRRYVKASELTPEMRTPLAAPLDVQSAGPLTADQIATLSWLVTDGTGLFNRRYCKSDIFQSRTANSWKCDEIASVTGVSGRPYGSQGMEMFPVRPNVRKILRNEVSDKDDLVRLICESGVSEATAFVRAADLAESSRQGDRYVFSQWGENKGVAEAYQVANLICGVPANISEKDYVVNGKKKTRFLVPARSSRTIRLLRDENSKWVPYSGTVWCPQVRTSAWVVRCNGCVMVTGNSGGTYERQVTLTTGTWPTDAAFGVVAIDGYSYRVEDRKSSTVVTLVSVDAPTADIASGTSYTWFRDRYPLPADARSIGSVIDPYNSVEMQLVSAQQMNDIQAAGVTTSTPVYYAIQQDDNYDGRLGLRMWPAPASAYTFDFIYQRRPAPLTNVDYSTGTISMTSGSAVVTGTSTEFTSSMVGDVFRIGTAAEKPTDFSGQYPAVFESRIKSFTSATSITLYDNADANYTTKKYRISDWWDVEDGAMSQAVYRCAEWQYAILMSRTDSDECEMRFRKALLSAREGDARSYTNRQAPLPLDIGSYPIDLTGI